MKRVLLPLGILILASLSCNQAVVTVTPSATLAPSATLPATATAAPSATATDDGQTAQVRAALVNVRQSPGGEVVGQLQAGTDVRVIGCEADWCEIQADDLTGFVFVGCLSIATGQGCEAR
jgi:uncharacterized protein YgiM (DUF1202 family)